MDRKMDKMNKIAYNMESYLIVAFLHLNFDCIVVVREGVHYRPFSLASVLLTIDSGGKNAAKRMKKLIASQRKCLANNTTQI